QQGMNGVIAQAVGILQYPESALLKQVQAVAGGHPYPAFRILEQIGDVIIAEASFLGGITRVAGNLPPGFIQHLNPGSRAKPELPLPGFHDSADIRRQGPRKVARGFQEGPLPPVHEINPSEERTYPEASLRIFK